MKSARRRWLAAGAAAAGGLTLGGWFWHQSRPSAEAALLGTASFPDLEGRRQALTQWTNRVVLFNFWATWCEPCKEEIPLLAAAQAKHSNGLQIVGIALDNVNNVQQFKGKIPINYPLLIGDIAALNLMRGWGNPSGALPFSIAFAPDGTIPLRHLGTVTAAQIETALAKTA